MLATTAAVETTSALTTSSSPTSATSTAADNSTWSSAAEPTNVSSVFSSCNQHQTDTSASANIIGDNALPVSTGSGPDGDTRVPISSAMDTTYSDSIGKTNGSNGNELVLNPDLSTSVTTGRSDLLESPTSTSGVSSDTSCSSALSSPVAQNVPSTLPTGDKTAVITKLAKIESTQTTDSRLSVTIAPTTVTSPAIKCNGEMTDLKDEGVGFEKGDDVDEDKEDKMDDDNDAMSPCQNLVIDENSSSAVADTDDLSAKTVIDKIKEVCAATIAKEDFASSVEKERGVEGVSLLDVMTPMILRELTSASPSNDTKKKGSISDSFDSHSSADITDFPYVSNVDAIVLQPSNTVYTSAAEVADSSSHLPSEDTVGISSKPEKSVPAQDPSNKPSISSHGVSSTIVPGMLRILHECAVLFIDV